MPGKSKERNGRACTLGRTIPTSVPTLSMDVRILLLLHFATDGPTVAKKPEREKQMPHIKLEDARK